MEIKVSNIPASLVGRTVVVVTIKGLTGNRDAYTISTLPNTGFMFVLGLPITDTTTLFTFYVKRAADIITFLQFPELVNASPTFSTVMTYTI